MRRKILVGTIPVLTWREALPALLMAVRQDKKRRAENVRLAYGELERMAEAADKYNEFVNKGRK